MTDKKRPKQRHHEYEATVVWTGAEDGGTVNYKTFSRTHTVQIPGKPPFEMSSDPGFIGDPAKLNPEDCLLVALSSCHMLSYLAFASIKGLEVVGYTDRPSGVMVQEGPHGRFVEVVLRPEVTIAAGASEEFAVELHKTASASCFIASSVNFPVRHEPTVITRTS